MDIIGENFCSRSCISKNINVLENKRKKCFEKYNNETFRNVEKIKQTNLEKFGDEFPFRFNSEQMNEIIFNKFGVKNVFQLDWIKDKIKQTNLEKYGEEFPFRFNSERMNEIIFKKFGVFHVSQVVEIYQKRFYKRKTMILPSGKKIFYQGYENVIIDKLLQNNFNENDIKLLPSEMPKIWYFMDIKRRYYPDIYIPKENLIIEVKSTYTYKKELEKNLLKREACLEMGFNFKFCICDKEEILYEL